MNQNEELVMHIFTESTIKALSVQCKVEAKAGKSYIRKEASPHCGIAGTVGFKNEKVTGVVALCFSNNVFLSIMNRMLNDNFKEITDDVASGASEILNIVYFNTRSELKSRGIIFSEAVPTAVQGTTLKTTHLGHATVLVVPFSSDVGEFQLEVSSSGAWCTHV